MLELLLPYIESKPIMREPLIAGDLRIYDASDYQKLVKMQNETMLTHISPISSCFFSQWPFPYTFSNLAVAIKRPTKKNLARLAMCAVSGKLMDKPTIAILSCRFSKHEPIRFVVCDGVMLSKKSLPDEITLIGMRPWRQMQQLIDLLREPLKKLELKQSTEVIFDAQCLWYMSLKTFFESHPR